MMCGSCECDDDECDDVDDAVVIVGNVIDIVAGFILSFFSACLSMCVYGGWVVWLSGCECLFVFGMLYV